MKDDPTIAELARRLAYTLVGPAAALCARFHIPVDELEQLARLAYYSELRKGGATQAEAARISGKSRRTVVSADQALRGDFLAPHEAVTLSRRVEEAIDAGPRPLAAIAAAVGAPAADVERVLVALGAANRAVQTASADGATTWHKPGRFETLVADTLPARFEGLRHQLEVVVSAVMTRFFGPGGDDAPPAVGRTLSFRGAADDVRRFADELIRTARHGAVDIEERALRDGRRGRYALTFALTPLEDDDMRSTP